MNLMLIVGGQLIAPSHQFINRHVFQLTKHAPHIVFLPTASRDERLYQEQFRSTYEALGVTVSNVTLFDDNKRLIHNDAYYSTPTSSMSEVDIIRYSPRHLRTLE